jgi:hypothetical protein
MPIPRRRVADSDPGQHVNWVGYHDHDCRRAHPVKLTDDAGDRIRVNAEEVKTGLTRLERHSRRDHHDITAAQVGVPGGSSDPHLRQQRHGVSDVPGLALGRRQVAIIEHYLVAHAKQDKRVRHSRADMSGSDNRHRRSHLVHPASMALRGETHAITGDMRVSAQADPATQR